ncbi:MAG: alpha/beta hydrolase [Gemmatimonadetes bacterium]|nr:alpha/beta hydrolase [Gemmatimonadota bacterium]
MSLFPGFEPRWFEVGEVVIHGVVGGSGPPVLLLHGYPQTHAIWHKVAPPLARRFTVVATDLRGYGASSKPVSTPDHAVYSKRAMAADQIRVMESLGFDRFAVAGHDRGGRVAHRMALDHPTRVTRWAALDIVPTRTMYQRADRVFAQAHYHWFFLIQPAPFPERLIESDPDFFLNWHLSNRRAGLDAFDPAALAAYRTAFRNPATVHATCEDYRAAATIDLEHDEADLSRRVSAPLLALWARHGIIERCFRPLDDWRDRVISVTGQALDCGHYLPEEAPAETARLLADFFG